jgi:hypothetical protein
LPSAPQLDLAELEPEEILDMQLTKKGNSTIVQVLVKWSTLSRDLATWEDYYVLRARYPSAP